MTTIGRGDGRLPILGVILALLFGGLLLVPVIARADSASSTAVPCQYRGPSNEVPRGGSVFLDPPSGGEGARSAEGWARWEFWFEYEKDALLRGALGIPRGATITGPGFPAAPDPGYDPLRPGDLDGRLLPALRAALRDPAVEVRIAALLALGNAKDAPSRAAMEERLARGSAAERRAAALGLGFLGDPLSLPALQRALADPEPEVRSMAVLSSGLLGSRDAAPGIRALLDRSLEVSGREAREVRVAAVTALGLLGDRASVQVLTRVLAARSLRDDRLRAHAATALGRVAEVAALPSLIAAAKEDSDASVRRAATLALGAFRGREVEAGLVGILDGDADALVRGFAALSLARSAGGGAVAVLAERTGIRFPRGLRGFAALGLGLTGAADSAAPPLRAEDSRRGAASVALGLLRDRASSARMLEVAADRSSSPELQGYALLGSALTGDPASGKPVAAALRDGGPALLLRLLIDARDPTVRGAAILGLGLAPDRGAVPLLADIAGDPEAAGSMMRVQAATTLGQVALRRGLPPVARLGAGLDYRALTDDLAAVTRLF